MMKFTILALTVLSLLLGGAVYGQTKRQKKKTPAPASGKITYEPDAEMLGNMQEKVSVIESKQDWAEFNRQSRLANAAKTRTAYVAKLKMENDPEVLLDVVVIHDAGTNKFYEIRGIEDFPWRPLSDFRWISDDVLQFEQWVNPDNGGRYQVNLKTGKIVAAGYVRSN